VRARHAETEAEEAARKAGGQKRKRGADKGSGLESAKSGKAGKAVQSEQMPRNKRQKGGPSLPGLLGLGASWLQRRPASLSLHLSWTAHAWDAPREEVSVHVAKAVCAVE
jgi:hypothetical protein